MASQQDIRRRIRSVRNTRKITKAMELVSGAKLRKAQARIERLRPFADAMHDLIAEAAGRARVARQPLLQRREPQRTGVLVCTGDRGLAGAFNASVLRRSLDEGAAPARRGAGARLVRRRQARRGLAALPRHRARRSRGPGFTDSPVYPDAEQIANRLITDYVEERVDRVVMIYNHFDSPLQQTVYVEQVLPVPIDEIEDAERPRDRAAGHAALRARGGGHAQDRSSRRPWRRRSSARCWSRRRRSTARA